MSIRLKRFINNVIITANKLEYGDTVHITLPKHVSIDEVSKLIDEHKLSMVTEVTGHDYIVSNIGTNSIRVQVTYVGDTYVQNATQTFIYKENL